MYSQHELIEQCNFRINLIIIDDEGIISHQNIENYIQGFSNCNSSPLVFENEEKYKLIFNPINIPSYANKFIIQVAIEKNGEFYNPYFFPIYTLDNFNDINNFKIIINRAININIQKSDCGYTIDKLHMYFTFQCIDDLLKNISCNELISPVKYCKEFIPNN